MRVVTLQLRSLAAVLVALWAVAAVLMLAAHGAQGRFDLVVAAAAFVPALVAAAALACPPVTGDVRASAAIRWLAIVTALLLIPSIAGLVPDPAPEAPRPVFPSPELAYALIVAVAGTSLFAGLGLARAVSREAVLRRRSLVAAVLIALLLAAIASAAFAAATFGTLAVGGQPGPPASAWGPTDARLAPPPCRRPHDVGSSARVEIAARGRVDTTSVGTISVTGARNGADERWEATRSTHRGAGTFEYARLAGRAWVRQDGGRWLQTDVRAARREMLDRAVLQALAPESRLASEDLGVELVGGAKARHCRAAVDGPMALEAFPALRWFLGQDPLAAEPALEVWQGELDWWVFADGQLGMASVAIRGPAFDGEWPARGFQVTLEAELKALDRGAPHAVEPPVPGG